MGGDWKHEAKTNHLIICCLAESIGNDDITFEIVKNRMGKLAENTLKGILVQHKKEYIEKYN